MSRVSIEHLKEIIDTQLTDDEITAFIGAAHDLVEELLEGKLPEARLEQVEKFLTAHFIAVTRERMETQHKVGEVSVTFGQALGAGLQGSTYGQTVLLLDTTKTLATAEKKKQKLVFKAF